MKNKLLCHLDINSGLFVVGIYVVILLPYLSACRLHGRSCKLLVVAEKAIGPTESSSSPSIPRIAGGRSFPVLVFFFFFSAFVRKANTDADGIPW